MESQESEEVREGGREGGRVCAWACVEKMGRRDERVRESHQVNRREKRNGKDAESWAEGGGEKEEEEEGMVCEGRGEREIRTERRRRRRRRKQQRERAPLRTCLEDE